MKVVGPRTFVELRVGDSQSVEVVIHVRRADIPWLNGRVLRQCKSISTAIDHDTAAMTTTTSQRDDDQCMFTQLLDIIQSSILPRMFADEIEKNFYSSMGRPPLIDLGPGGIPTLLATSQVPKSTATVDIALPSKKSYYNKRQRISKVKLAEIKRLEHEAARQQRQDEKDIFYATNSENTMQVAYRLEILPKFGHATLLFQRHEQQCTNLVSLKKLQRRILLWCHPINTGEGTERKSIDVAGLYNPEMIPASTYL